jgi:hypothetical protein
MLRVLASLGVQSETPIHERRLRFTRRLHGRNGFAFGGS